MKLEGPEEYKLAMTPDGYKVECRRGTSKFSGLATRLKTPKLYILSVDRMPIYIGQTTQTMSTRFRAGWKASGKGGYWGYKFRHTHTSADLAVWCNPDVSKDGIQDIETVEAEVAFLVRSARQWPVSQTEIHFHPSSDTHREVAAEIMRHYQI
jgi:hypothetical protein